MKPTLVNHKQKILNERQANFKLLAPGQIVRFRYNAPSTDPYPLVLALYLEQNKLLHCVNLNYLPENEVQKLFRMLASKYGVDQPESMNGEKVESYSQIGIPTRGGGLRSPIGKEIYTRIIRPIFMENYSCYRTYVINKIASVRLVEYDMDIVKSGMSRVSPDEVKKRMEDAIGGEVSKQINKRGKK